MMRQQVQPAAKMREIASPWACEQRLRRSSIWPGRFTFIGPRMQPQAYWVFSLRIFVTVFDVIEKTTTWWPVQEERWLNGSRAQRKRGGRGSCPCSKRRKGLPGARLGHRTSSRGEGLPGHCSARGASGSNSRNQSNLHPARGRRGGRTSSTSTLGHLIMTEFFLQGS